MKALLLVHVEETYRDKFGRHMLSSIINTIKKGEFDYVFHFTSHILDSEPVWELIEYVDINVEWGYGYEPDMFRGAEKKFVIPSYGHEWTWIPPTLRKWKPRLQKAKVIIGGGSDGECLTDMESILWHLKIQFTRKMEFIYS